MAIGPNIPMRRTDVDMSPRARDLNQKLGEVIEEFRRYYPDTTDSDVRDALQSAGQRHAGPAARRVAIAGVAAGVIAAALGAMVASGGSVPELSQGEWIGIAGLVAAVVIFLVRVGRRD